jgi:predicted nucleic acid-binding protein
VKKHLKRPQDEVKAFIRRFKRVAIVVEPGLTLKVIEDDPADNRVLECAVAGGAAYIISGDDHLLRIKEFKEIVILRPAGFLTLLDLT